MPTGSGTQDRGVPIIPRLPISGWAVFGKVCFGIGLVVLSGLAGRYGSEQLGYAALYMSGLITGGWLVKSTVPKPRRKGPVEMVYRDGPLINPTIPKNWKG